MSRSFLSLLLVAFAVASTQANPVVQVRDNLVRLPIAKRINATGSGNLLARDQARVKHLNALAKSRIAGTSLSSDAVISVPVDNQAVSYIATVRVL